MGSNPSSTTMTKYIAFDMSKVFFVQMYPVDNNFVVSSFLEGITTPSILTFPDENAAKIVFEEIADNLKKRSKKAYVRFSGS